jgi:hypothetical protein
VLLLLLVDKRTCQLQVPLLRRAQLLWHVQLALLCLVLLPLLCHALLGQQQASGDLSHQQASLHLNQLLPPLPLLLQQLMLLPNWPQHDWPLSLLHALQEYLLLPQQQQQ